MSQTHNSIDSKYPLLKYYSEWYLLKEPVVPVRSLSRFLLLLLLLLPIALLLLARWCILTKEPPVAFFDIFFGGFRGCWYLFSSFSIRPRSSNRLPMSGGLDNMKHAVEVTAKPALVPASFNKLNQPQFTQEMQVALDCPD